MLYVCHSHLSIRLRLTDEGPQVLHLLAMARAAEIDLTIDDFQMVADKTPFLADLM